MVLFEEIAGPEAEHRPTYMGITAPETKFMWRYERETADPDKELNPEKMEPPGTRSQFYSLMPRPTPFLPSYPIGLDPWSEENAYWTSKSSCLVIQNIGSVLSTAEVTSQTYNRNCMKLSRRFHRTEEKCMKLRHDTLTNYFNKFRDLQDRKSKAILGKTMKAKEAAQRTVSGLLAAIEASSIGRQEQVSNVWECLEGVQIAIDEAHKEVLHQRSLISRKNKKVNIAEQELYNLMENDSAVFEVKDALMAKVLWDLKQIQTFRKLMHRCTVPETLSENDEIGKAEEWVGIRRCDQKLFSVERNVLKEIYGPIIEAENAEKLRKSEWYQKLPRILTEEDKGNLLSEKELETFFETDGHTSRSSKETD